jgi:hypothetical protein
MDCNFFVVKPRNFDSPIKIFYDTLHDKFVHHRQTLDFDKNMLKRIEQNLGIKISDVDEEKYPVFCLKGHPDTKYILINT